MLYMSIENEKNMTINDRRTNKIKKKATKSGQKIGLNTGVPCGAPLSEGRGRGGTIGLFLALAKKEVSK